MSYINHTTKPHSLKHCENKIECVGTILRRRRSQDDTKNFEVDSFINILLRISAAVWQYGVRAQFSSMALRECTSQSMMPPVL